MMEPSGVTHMGANEMVGCHVCHATGLGFEATEPTIKAADSESPLCGMTDCYLGGFAHSHGTD